MSVWQRIMKPIYAQGKIVKGFGRGSKDLGIPTGELISLTLDLSSTCSSFSANFPEEVVEGLPPEIDRGIYYGWAKVDNGETHKMVLSIGWNPYYNNDRKSMVP